MTDSQSHSTRRERYTHGYADAVMQSHAARTVENSLAYGQAHLRPGMTVLDLGCGAGTITADIAGRIAPGRVIAVDIDLGVLALASQTAADRGLVNIDFQVGDAYGLDLADGAVDMAHAHQLLQHVQDPVAVLAEMARVTRPGGVVAARDGDYASFTWYPASDGLDEWLRLYRLVARSNGGEPDAGRHLLAWAHQAGLSQVVASCTSWTFAAGPAARWWGHNWADRVLHSSITQQFLDSSEASPTDLAAIAQAWITWSEHPDAWFSAPSAEILATV